MRACVVAVLIAVGGCGFFGGAERAPSSANQAEIDAAAARDASQLLGPVETLTAEDALRGVILRASAVPPSQGWYGATFRPVTEEPEGGVLTLELRAFPPPEPLPAGTPASRRVHAALFLPEADLEGVQRFRVRTAGGEVTLRR